MISNAIDDLDSRIAILADVYEEAREQRDLEGLDLFRSQIQELAAQRRQILRAHSQKRVGVSRFGFFTQLGRLAIWNRTNVKGTLPNQLAC